MKLEVVTPEENMGDVIGDLNKRRGQVEGMGDKPFWEPGSLKATAIGQKCLLRNRVTYYHSGRATFL